MRNHDRDDRVEARGEAAAANGAAAAGRKRRKQRTRRSWSVDEKFRIARESFASAETITAVAERHGTPRNRLSSWRTQLRRVQLVAPSSAQARPDAGGELDSSIIERMSLAPQGLLRETPGQAPLLSIYGTADMLMPIEDRLLCASAERMQFHVDINSVKWVVNDN